MKPEDRKRLKQHIKMIVDHKLPGGEMTETISTGNLKKDYGRMAHNELANQADIDFWRTKFEEAREAYIKAGVDLDEVHLVLSSTENANEIIQLQLDDRNEENKKLRLELHTLRFKESQEQRFIWWIWNVYSKNVMDTIAAITEACTYQDEATAASGKYGLPIKCFEMMRRLTESSHGIYDGTYLDVS